jgi:nanoRNase/pAp phosphatase (c-di-AMP/oligoRNAs hydrolase)
VVLISDGEYTSELGDAVWDKGLGVDYAVIVIPGTNVVSLRSPNDGKEVDVSSIAKQFPGGGGHAGAAGFSPEESFNELIVEHVRTLLDE